MDNKWAATFAEEWIAAWNSHDMERILSHYTDDFEMSSPYIVQRMNEPSGILKGKEAVGNYWRTALETMTDLKFELEDVLIGANSITILYKNQMQIPVAEVLVFNAEAQATSGSAHYGAKQEF